MGTSLRLNAVVGMFLCFPTGRGAQIGRALVTHAGDRGFEPMVESNQYLSLPSQVLKLLAQDKDWLSQFQDYVTEWDIRHGGAMAWLPSGTAPYTCHECHKSVPILIRS